MIRERTKQNIILQTHNVPSVMSPLMPNMNMPNMIMQ